ncbi:MAG TPA: T9SS type A sorting domain-containing protein, partial [Ignavibacteriaceae bacterium]
IQYAIPQQGNVSLKVYDILGKEVAILVDEFKSAGSYEVEFKSSVSSRQLASGVYLYKIQSGDFVQTRKMILLK